MAKKKTANSDIENLSFEQAIGDLTGIVEKIETGQVSLAESLSQYEKGMDLIKHCRRILLDAEKRIEKISAEQQGEPEPDEDENEDADDERDEPDDAEDDSLF